MDQSSRPVSKTFHTVQLVFSTLSILFLWGTAALVLFYAVVTLAIPDFEAARGNQLLVVSFALAALGVILLPSTVFPILSLQGKDTTHLTFKGHVAFWFIPPLWVGLALAGRALSEADGAIQFIFPIIHVLVVTIPIFFIMGLAIRKLRFRTPQRASGLIATGMASGSFFSMLVEVAAILFLFITGVFILVLNPELQAKALLLSNRIMVAGDDPEVLMQIFLPALQNPWVFVGILLFISGLVPLVEEALKPVGFWILTSRDWTPRDGFIGGLMSGAGFAFIESILASAQVMGDDWFFLVINRIGTAVMHMLASGMVGWGLASAWHQRRYGRLIGGYLLAVVLHGVWNSTAIVLGISEIVSSGKTQWLKTPGMVSPYLLGTLTVGGLLAIILINRHFQKTAEDNHQGLDVIR